jgi:hypothetical protein
MDFIWIQLRFADGSVANKTYDWLGFNTNDTDVVAQTVTYVVFRALRDMICLSLRIAKKP